MIARNLDFGPMVQCTFTGEDAWTHRDSPRSPYFCGNCGATDHEVAE